MLLKKQRTLESPEGAGAALCTESVGGEREAETKPICGGRAVSQGS